MKSSLIILAGIFLISIFSVCSAQSTATISTPKLQLLDNNVSILYDILNSIQSEKFNISLEVTDSDGKHVAARSISGDIGVNVSGGPGKEINWNLSADNVYLEAMLYFQVTAEVVKPVRSSEINTSTENLEVSGATGNLSRSSVVLQSLLLPGLGLSRIKGKPHWLRGALGYGCIASCVAFTINSERLHSEYEQATDMNERDDLFETFANQRNVANAQLYAAIGIWIVDIVWTMAGSKELSKKVVFNQTNGFSINPSYNTEAQAPLLSLKYNF